ncbi:phospholipase [Ornithinimicrobium sp. F0845]|uniref:phospholipase n=1 Tax=Ornithinimicrobium sp. F0845 TaxID=2926412 RepID=UPI001FF3F73E|nr:phospholipase [Ornithinimicrobium sp. F0845]MCK0112160.1 phospholipase [Ornithinimicrobium sp. F0845]
MTSRRVNALLLSLIALAAAGGLTLAGTGAEAGEEQTPAAVAVRALTAGTAGEALEAVPEDFDTVVGYRPVLQDGQVVRADGGCSSPVTLPQRFEPACRQHDYGYDLLRYAERTGQPLGRWARGEIDDRFADQVRALCAVEVSPEAADRCRVSAEIAVAGVEFNSVRQGDGVPEESLLTNTAVAASAVGLLGMGAALPRRRR